MLAPRFRLPSLESESGDLALGLNDYTECDQSGVSIMNGWEEITSPLPSVALALTRA